MIGVFICQGYVKVKQNQESCVKTNPTKLRKIEISGQAQRTATTPQND